MSKRYDFNVEAEPDLSEVGGKALSLIHLTKGGFKVPEGAVLTEAFFKPWIETLQKLPRMKEKWKNPEAFKELAENLKSEAVGLSFSEEQKAIVQDILGTLGNEGRFAVRSSSPEEDLAGASFAGGYETILGATKNNILEAIRRAFVSCTDERVFFYKHQQGFDTTFLRIAVIIQRQISSDSAGVGFSLNPLTNCFDEAVINANIGLGESVVSGLVTPDEFVVDKNSGEILERRMGSKEKSVVLDLKSGTRMEEGKMDGFAVADGQAIRICELIREVEAFYGFPVDIEWAFEGETLWLLQARPITAYIPLPDEMQTAYEERPILFLDASLVKQGITTPISVLGCDLIGVTQGILLKNLMGKDISKDIKGGMAMTRGGRMYVNVSASVKFQGLKRFVGSWRMIDLATADMLETIDLDKYIPPALPEGMRGAKWGAVKNNVGTLKRVRRAAGDPEAYKEWYQPFEDEFDAFLKNFTKTDGTLGEASEQIIGKYIRLLDKMLPMTYAAELARGKIKKMIKEAYGDETEKMQYLERSLPDNVTIDMGMRMYALSQKSEIKENDYESFKRILQENRCSEAFSEGWKNYLAQYGCRTRNELDVGVVRPSEDFGNLFAQIKAMSAIEEDFSPQGIYIQSQERRKEIFEEMRSMLPSGKRRKFEKQYRVLVAMGGKREALKYWYIRSLAAMRKIILDKARQLVLAGKLETEADIFWLDFNLADHADRIGKEELYGWIEKGKAYYLKLEQVRQFPKMIDSRGRVPQMPKREAREGELEGQAISPGLVTGRVKILSSPNEKPLLPGEILVTRATDPGWTPLFINASAILLEVGGLLQHGALVAREYGKPCIAGIENVMDVLKDGQLVEVDAARGLVLLLEEGHEKAC